MDWILLEAIDDNGARLVALRLSDGARRVLYEGEHPTPLHAAVDARATRAAVDATTHGRIRGQLRGRVGLVNLERPGLGWLKWSLDPRWRLSRAAFDDTGNRLAFEAAFDGVPTADIYVVGYAFNGSALQETVLAGAGNPQQLGCAQPRFLAGGEQLIYLRNTRAEGAWELCLLDLTRPGDSAWRLEGRAPSVLSLTLTEGAEAVPEVPLVYCPTLKQAFWVGRARGGTRQVVRTSRLGTRPHHELGRQHQRIEEICVAPGGELMAYAADGQIWLADTEEGAAVSLVTGDKDASHRGITFDLEGGRLIYCTSDAQGARVRAIRLDDRRVETLHALGDMRVLRVLSLPPHFEVDARLAAFGDEFEPSSETVSPTVPDVLRRAGAGPQSSAALLPGALPSGAPPADPAVGVGRPSTRDPASSPASSPGSSPDRSGAVGGAGAASAADSVSAASEDASVEPTPRPRPAEVLPTEPPADRPDPRRDFGLWMRTVPNAPDPGARLRSLETLREDPAVREAARVHLGTQRRRAPDNDDPPPALLFALAAAAHLRLDEARRDLLVLCNRAKPKVDRGRLPGVEEHFALAALLYLDGERPMFDAATVFGEHAEMMARIEHVRRGEGEGKALRVVDAHLRRYGAWLRSALSRPLPARNPTPALESASLLELAAAATEAAQRQVARARDPEAADGASRSAEPAPAPPPAAPPATTAAERGHAPGVGRALPEAPPPRLGGNRSPATEPGLRAALGPPPGFPTREPSDLVLGPAPALPGRGRPLPALTGRVSLDDDPDPEDLEAADPADPADPAGAELDLDRRAAPHHPDPDPEGRDADDHDLDAGPLAELESSVLDVAHLDASAAFESDPDTTLDGQSGALIGPEPDPDDTLVRDDGSLHRRVEAHRHADHIADLGDALHGDDPLHRPPAETGPLPVEVPLLGAVAAGAVAPPTTPARGSAPAPTPIAGAPVQARTTPILTSPPTALPFVHDASEHDEHLAEAQRDAEAQDARLEAEAEAWEARLAAARQTAETAEAVEAADWSAQVDRARAEADRAALEAADWQARVEAARRDAEAADEAWDRARAEAEARVDAARRRLRVEVRDGSSAPERARAAALVERARRDAEEEAAAAEAAFRRATEAAAHQIEAAERAAQEAQAAALRLRQVRGSLPPGPLASEAALRSPAPLTSTAAAARALADTDHGPPGQPSGPPRGAHLRDTASGSETPAAPPQARAAVSLLPPVVTPLPPFRTPPPGAPPGAVPPGTPPPVVAAPPGIAPPLVTPTPRTTGTLPAVVAPPGVAPPVVAPSAGNTGHHPAVAPAPSASGAPSQWTPAGPAQSASAQPASAQSASAHSASAHSASAQSASARAPLGPLTPPSVAVGPFGAPVGPRTSAPKPVPQPASLTTGGHPVLTGFAGAGSGATPASAFRPLTGAFSPVPASAAAAPRAPGPAAPPPRAAEAVSRSAETASRSAETASRSAEAASRSAEAATRPVARRPEPGGGDPLDRFGPGSDAERPDADGLDAGHDALGPVPGLPPAGRAPALVPLAGLVALAGGISEMVVASKLVWLFWPMGLLFMVTGIGLLGDRRWGHTLALAAFGANAVFLVGYATNIDPSRLWWVPPSALYGGAFLCLAMLVALASPGVRGRYQGRGARGF